MDILLYSLYYSSSTDIFSTIMGLVFIILIGIFCCSSLKDDDSTPKKYNSGGYSGTSRSYSGSSSRTYNSGGYRGTSRYYDEEINYNWDDSWDDKWLHQGEYADVVDDTSTEYTDYDPSWDEQYRE